MSISGDIAFYGVKKLAEKYLNQIQEITELLKREDKNLYEKAMEILLEVKNEDTNIKIIKKN